MYSVSMPTLPSHALSSLATNSGPLSERMCSGIPRNSITSARASITSYLPSLLATRIARPSRVYSSITHSQNGTNRRKRKGTSSKFLGVYWLKRDRAFQATIRVHGKHVYLGYFRSEVDAARAFDTAARKYHGAFARLNFPTVGEQAASPNMIAAVAS